jgi:hypothetical protein
MKAHVTFICEAPKRDWRAAAWMLERRFPEDFSRPQQFGHSGPGAKPLTPAPDEDYEVLRRMKKRQGIKELLMKLGGIIGEKRRQAKETTKAENEASMLQAPLLVNTK